MKAWNWDGKTLYPRNKSQNDNLPAGKGGRMRKKEWWTNKDDVLTDKKSIELLATNPGEFMRYLKEKLENAENEFDARRKVAFSIVLKDKKNRRRLDLATSAKKSPFKATTPSAKETSLPKIQASIALTKKPTTKKEADKEKRIHNVCDYKGNESNYNYRDLVHCKKQLPEIAIKNIDKGEVIAFMRTFCSTRVLYPDYMCDEYQKMGCQKPGSMGKFFKHFKSIFSGTTREIWVANDKKKDASDVKQIIPEKCRHLAFEKFMIEFTNRTCVAKLGSFIPL